MKMAENNCVEVINEADEKNPNNDITEIATNTNKPEDEPNGGMTGDATQEDAVEKFLAGESKTDFNDDLLLENIEADGIDFKSDNVIMDCPDLEKPEFFEGADEDDADDDKVETLMSPGNSIEEEAENSQCCKTTCHVHDEPVKTLFPTTWRTTAVSQIVHRDRREGRTNISSGMATLTRHSSPHSS
ncbi:hypothetical protein GEV33_005170 [Tenebrio molitor]|uniref:Uncharacterized protein n=1 Tax=Tenebrio molitor TaxID=7067 RepID=A0A8J6HM20_TENMO|nr:hypothetical protein GEV33_005170 [Tenebrio molitor]